MKKLGIILSFLIIPAIFFKPFFLNGNFPIPSDTIAGLYYPFRDLYTNTNPNGVPFKNFLITDPVRQQIPWRSLAISAEKSFQIPLWNPYSFSGYPLLANQQSAVFYPLNILFFVIPFTFAWSILIFLQIVLAGIFTYFYLRNKSLSVLACIFGSIVFSFSGFMVAWLEWGTIDNVALWLPLVLLSIDKIVNSTDFNKKWTFILSFSLICSFLAGHLQTFFYLIFFAFCYLVFSLRFLKSNSKKIIPVMVAFAAFIIITIFQWWPTLQFILFSARNMDQSNWHAAGWFIPWQNLAQFLAPDFFGNPTTLNYWGIWNYGEFIGYIGILPLLMVIISLIYKKTVEVKFFAFMLLLSFLFALPTGISQIPFLLQIPFLSTSQPTRLLFIIDFCLAILSAYGFELLVDAKNKFWWPIGILIFLTLLLWSYVLLFHKYLFVTSAVNISVTKHNLELPTLFVLITILLVLAYQTFPKNQYKKYVLIMILIFTIIDVFRFANKFLPFTSPTYFFPSTKVTTFLQYQNQPFRIMSVDDRIMPPNFSTSYKLQTIEGYDPLYLKSYGELIAAINRNKPDVSPPLGFNRIVVTHNYGSPLIDLLNVKYVLSLSDISSPKLRKVFQDGQTKIYENKNVLPRVFFVKNIDNTASDQQTLTKLFSDNLKNSAVLSGLNTSSLSLGTAEITSYQNNQVEIETSNIGTGFLVLTDAYYPIWQASIDGVKTPIYKTDYTFRGIIVPAGTHKIEFYDKLF